MMFGQRHQPPLLHRLTALLGVTLVLLLGLLAVCPGLHAWLHGHGRSAGWHKVSGGEATDPAASGHAHPGPAAGHEGDAEQGCVVTLFAGGIVPFLILGFCLLVRSWSRRAVGRVADWLAVAPPHYWHLPAHAPPLA